MSHAKPFAVGLNCALGASDMQKYVANLSKCADCYVFCYPNAGLPNAMGGYDQKGPAMAEEIRPFCEDKLVNALGGCCGSGPEHIAAIRLATVTPVACSSGLHSSTQIVVKVKMIFAVLICWWRLQVSLLTACSWIWRYQKSWAITSVSRRDMKCECREMASAYPPRKRHKVDSNMRLSGLEPLTYEPNREDMRQTFLSIGERCNVAGSAMYKKAIVDGEYDKAAAIATKQVCEEFMDQRFVQKQILDSRSCFKKAVVAENHPLFAQSLESSVCRERPEDSSCFLSWDQCRGELIIVSDIRLSFLTALKLATAGIID